MLSCCKNTKNKLISPPFGRKKRYTTIKSKKNNSFHAKLLSLYPQIYPFTVIVHNSQFATLVNYHYLCNQNN